MPKTTTAEASRQQYELAWQEHWIYKQLFKFYGTACLKAKSPHPPWKPPVFEPSMRSIVARADREWTKLTDLPHLDACNPSTWWAAAIAAGREGQPVPNVRVLSVRALGEIIVPWATARMASAEPAAADTPVYPLTAEELTVIEVLGRERPMLVTQDGVAAEIKATPRTTGKWMQSLENAKLISRPRGPKKGYGLTEAGLAILSRR